MMKYIVMVNEKTKEKELFIFPKSINHKCMAENLSTIRVMDGFSSWHREFRKPISAGFCSRGAYYGRSESLNLESNQDHIKECEQ